jgi:integrase
MPPVRQGKVFALETVDPQTKRPLWAYRLHRGPGGQVGGFKSKSDALTALDEAKRRDKLGVHHDPRATVADLVAEFLNDYRAKANTRATLEARLKWVTKPTREGGLGDVRVDRLNPVTIRRWRNGLPAGSAWHIHKALSQVLNDAVRNRAIAANVARDVKNPEPNRPEVPFFHRFGEVDAVAAEMNERNYAIPLFAALTGLRPEEWIPLRARDLDLKAREVHVRRTYTGGILADSPTTGKGARRSVPLPDEAVEIMKAWPTPIDPDGLLFPNERGELISLAAWRRNHWNPAVISAGFGETVEREGKKPLERATRTPYALRHTYAAHMIAAGIPTDTLARYMGTSVREIERTYGHLLKDSADLLRSRANEYLRAARAREVEIEREEPVSANVLTPT